jgi:hypothetical protein
MKNIIIIATMVLLLTTTGYCATYYVNGASGLDTNPGTIGSPWKTIYKANQTLVAGDTVYIRGGVSDYQIYNVGGSSTTSEGINPRNSGTSSSARITYSVYPGEKVSFVGTTNDSTTTAISIVNKNWIKVTGYGGSTSARNMKFSNMGYFLMIWDGKNQDGSFGVGSSYNEISYCEFAQTTSGWITSDYADAASKLQHNSTYNWVHHNTFYNMGGCNTTNDISAVLNLGWEDCGYSTGGICSDNTHDNVIEDNIMYHGGHQVIGLFNYNNVIRNNILHNERWFAGGDSIRHGYRVITTQSTYNTDYHHKYNLIEGNSISHASENMIPGNLGGTGIHLSISYTIIRQNNFYANNGQSILMEVHDRTNGRVNYNHIYNNTFFANGYGATQPLGKSLTRSNPPDRSIIHINAGPTEATYWNTVHYGTVIKNNLSWKNYHWLSTMMYNNGWGLTGCSKATCGDTVNSNNFNSSGTPVDPKFTSEGSYGNPTISNNSYDWYWTTPNGSDVTTVNTEPIFTLQSSSPAIDGGTYLTTTTGAGTNSTNLVVADANYFQPGFGSGAGGGAAVQADWVAVGTVSNVAQISSINYTANTITLASPLAWSNGASVWLYKNSSGTQVLRGSAPDYGAHEYGGMLPPPNFRKE